jgi:hypothetical protein
MEGILMRFEEAHAHFIESHAKKRSGDRLYHLKKGHEHAEQLFLKLIWWIAFGNFDHLHPQYEVYDFKDGKRYLDFAFILGFIKICIEIDGFGPHWQNMSLEKFSDDRTRQNYLSMERWIILRFSYDDIVNHPRQCQQILQQQLGLLLGNQSNVHLNHYEQEVVRYGLKTNGILNIHEIHDHLMISDKAARILLRSMAQKNLLRPIGGPMRIHSYQLVYEIVHKLYL